MAKMKGKSKQTVKLGNNSYSFVQLADRSSPSHEILKEMDRVKGGNDFQL